MKYVKIFILFTFCFVVISCKNKAIGLKLEKSSTVQKNIRPYVLDYTFTSTEKKDTIMLSIPIHFRLTNNSNYDYDYDEIRQANYEFFRYFLLNSKKYSDSEMLKKKCILMSNKNDDIIYFFETRVSKKTLEKDVKVKLFY